MATITQGATSIVPALVLGYTATRAAGNVLHPIIGRASPDVTLRPAALRTGTLTLFFTTAAAAWIAHNTHALPGKLTLTDLDIPQIGMVYVLAGSLTIALDDGRRRWVVTVDYQEVTG